MSHYSKQSDGTYKCNRCQKVVQSLGWAGHNNWHKKQSLKAAKQNTLIPITHEILKREKCYMSGDTWAFGAKCSCGKKFAGWIMEEVEKQAQAHLALYSSSKMQNENEQKAAENESSTVKQ